LAAVATRQVSATATVFTTLYLVYMPFTLPIIVPALLE
jgi:hypothetical protein